MLDLLYRVQARRNDAEQFRDVAHTRIGDMRSVYRGYGMDFEESRPYLPGDELRFMNWRLTARTGQPYMKVFREERRPGVFIVIDRRAAMRFGSQTRLKATQAVRAAAVAAFSAQLQHIPVGGVILEHAPRWLSEASGEQAAFRLLQAASTPCPPQHAPREEPSLQHILKLLQAILVRGSKLYLVSDFHDLDDAARPVLLQLATDHHVYALQVCDPLEQHLPSMGKLGFIAPGAGQTITLDTANTAVQQAYRDAARDHFQSHRNLFSSLGIQHRLIPTGEQAIEDAVPFA
jgi:uncharacterized protein (DUF58 family)